MTWRGAPWVVLLITAVLFGLVAAFVDLKPEVDENFFFSTSDPQLGQSKKIEQRFPSPSELILTVSSSSISSSHYLGRPAHRLEPDRNQRAMGTNCDRARCPRSQGHRRASARRCALRQASIRAPCLFRAPHVRPCWRSRAAFRETSKQNRVVPCELRPQPSSWFLAKPVMRPPRGSSRRDAKSRAWGLQGGCQPGRKGPLTNLLRAQRLSNCRRYCGLPD